MNIEIEDKQGKLRQVTNILVNITDNDGYKILECEAYEAQWDDNKEKLTEQDLEVLNDNHMSAIAQLAEENSWGD